MLRSLVRLPLRVDTWSSVSLMRPTYSAEAEAYREKVQAFLAEKLPANWKGIGAESGRSHLNSP